MADVRVNGVLLHADNFIHLWLLSVAESFGIGNSLCCAEAK
jgi:hypothetical protein